MPGSPQSVATPNFRHVTFGWDSPTTPQIGEEVAELIRRSNLLGSDQRITNTGGGNTSAKIEQPDPITGKPVRVLWVKGSGGDLRTATKANFASLDLAAVERLEAVYAKAASEGKAGAKTPIEDWMVGAYPHCTFNLNPCVASIDTPLHAFVPAAHVDHTHPNAVIAVAASKDGKALTKEIWGGEVGWVDWQRPGFDLGLKIREEIARNSKNGPGIKGIVMGQHGLINWGDTGYSCYVNSLDLIERAARYLESKDRGSKTFGGSKYEDIAGAKREELLAELLPWLRGKVSGKARFFGTVEHRAEILRFVNSHDAARLAELGTSCPDHFLRTKIKPLFVDWNPASGTLDSLKAMIEQGLTQYRKDYAAYYERCKRPDSPAMRDPNPTVVLVPGLGMIAWGKTKSESRVTAEFFCCAVEVMKGAEAIGGYIALPQQEAFDIEYWLLEEAKLKRMPAEKELARHIAIVVGAGNGIGRVTAQRLAKDGAHIVCADLVESAAKGAAEDLTKIHGTGIGVAGSGVSSCGPATSTVVDVTDRESVRAMLRHAVLAYGGIDTVVVTAGVYIAPGADGRVTDDQWRTTYEVNVRGMAVVAEEAARVFKAQGLRGSIVLTTSVNGVVPKKGSLAYDTSKAAANHLVRELAIELAPLVRVNGVAPATVVEGSTMFPRDRVIASLVKYNIPFTEMDSTDGLRSKLAEFYAQRTLLRTPITPSDQAEAVHFLASERSARTTGQIINVDGGLHEAFQR
jgi:rhamnulose-1-phosphate aldolase/alcohol dehydrogenase